MDKVQLDEFACHKCGKQCPVAPADDSTDKTVCEDCCEYHEYEYDKWRRGRFCKYCDREQDPPYWDY